MNVTKALLVGSMMLATASLACHPAQAQQVNWGYLSMNLKEGMSEQQVTNAIGYLPNKIELKTCGNQSQDGSWSCKKYTFGNLDYSLTVYFHQTDERGPWHVNNWFVDP